MAYCSYCCCALSSNEVTFSCPNCSDAYCSVYCLKHNWEPYHREWCGVKYGRSGVDWEVRHISDGKGEGVVALRDFEWCERIMVDRMIDGELMAGDAARRAIVERLEPRGSEDLYEKFRINAIGSNDHRGIFGGLCVNLSKANHKCQANAFTHYEPMSKMMALIAAERIKAGDEITISYTEFLNPDTCSGKAAKGVHTEILRTQYGIVCDEGCGCNNALLVKERELSRMLDMKHHQHLVDGNHNSAYHCLVQRLAITKHPRVLRGVYFDLFNVCNVSGRQEQARGYIKRALRITADMSHPHSLESTTYIVILKSQRMHTFYTLRDRREGSS